MIGGSGGVAGGRRRSAISGDERQCAVQSLTDKRSLLTHAD